MIGAGAIVATRWRNRVGARLAVPGVLAAIVALVDQLTKAAVADWLGREAARHRWELVEAIAAFEYVENTGAAFGLFRGGGGTVAALGIVVVAALSVYYVRVDRPSRILTASLGLLIGGGIGNLIDRIRLGYVVDFVAIGVWPKFNVADTAVSLGVLFLAWHAVAENRSPGDEMRGRAR